MPEPAVDVKCLQQLRRGHAVLVRVDRGRSIGLSLETRGRLKLREAPSVSRSCASVSLFMAEPRSEWMVKPGSTLWRAMVSEKSWAARCLHSLVATIPPMTKRLKRSMMTYAISNTPFCVVASLVMSHVQTWFGAVAVSNGIVCCCGAC